MKRLTLALAMALAFSATGFAQTDDFSRERKTGETVKDSLEGKAPPALQVKDWMNTDGKAIDLKALRGKVVILDFWGTW